MKESLAPSNPPPVPVARPAAYIDALGKTVDIPLAPERIVSLVPSVTETLFAFGLGDRIAGVTRYCVAPADGVRGKPKVGGTKNVDVERLLALRPDLVIANAEENTRDDIERLMAAGTPVFVTFARTVAEAVAEMRTLATITGATRPVEPVIAACEEALAAAEARSGPAVPVFCPVWRSPWMTVNAGTYIHDMLRLCGGENIFADAHDRYPVVTLEDAAARRAAAVLLPDEPYRFGPRHVPEVIAALGTERIHLVDGKLLCWYGPRIPDGLRTIRSLLDGAP
jgi:ABC-type Fe3+-hydroxamate transport system substrate-binding protein